MRFPIYRPEEVGLGRLDRRSIVFHHSVLDIDSNVFKAQYALALLEWMKDSISCPTANECVSSPLSVAPRNNGICCNFDAVWRRLRERRDSGIGSGYDDYATF